MYYTNKDIPLRSGNALSKTRQDNESLETNNRVTVYEIGCLCWKVFAELCNSDLKKSFLSAENQQEIFKEIVNISYFNDDVAFRSIPALCSNGHNIVEGVSIRFYNCMCKNLIRQLTEKGRGGTSAKIKKLSSN